jgi:hypothetical protein
VAQAQPSKAGSDQGFERLEGNDRASIRGSTPHR